MPLNGIILDGDKKIYDLSKIDGECVFIDRRKNSDTLIMLLAGYKSFLYEDVFARLKAFAPPERTYA